MAKQSNPYQFAVDIDDDLFDQRNTGTDAPTEHHSFTGTPCTKCHRVHDLFIPNTVIPLDVSLPLSGFLDTMPEELLDLAVYSAVTLDSQSITVGFDRFSHEVLGMNQQSSLILACATVLNEQTNGEVGRRYIVYMAEQRLINCHVLTRLLNSYMKHLREDERAGKLRIPPHIERALTEVVQVCEVKIEEAAEAYRQACAANNMVVDDEVIATGHPNAEKTFAKDMLVDTMNSELARQANEHERHHHDHDHDETFHHDIES